MATRAEADFLRTVAEQYVLAQFPAGQDGGARIDVKAARLDERRDYGGKCEGYLTAELNGSRITRSSQVKITCSKPGSAYTIYVPVTVRRLVPTVTAATNIPRSAVITQDMLRQDYVDESTNSQAAVNDAQALVGAKLKREVREGEQIRSGDFCMVCRGDPVNIEAVTSNLSLKAQGEALTDGNLNDQVQIRNSKSKKVIQATVTGAGTVRVLL
ncbi:MAG: flagellar basal body P-ring formation chaperone FlgA [Succinivibrio sp.]